MFLYEKLEESDLVSVTCRNSKLSQSLVESKDLCVDHEKRVLGHLNSEVGVLFAVVLRIDLFTLNGDHDLLVYVHLVE